MPMTPEQLIEHEKKHGPFAAASGDEVDPSAENTQKSLDVAYARIEKLEQRVMDLIRSHAKLSNQLAVVKSQTIFK